MFKKFLLKAAENARPYLRNMAEAFVVATEKSMYGQSGSTKRAEVIARLDDAVKLPVWLEPFDNLIFGLLVDTVCDTFNDLLGHNWLTK